MLPAHLLDERAIISPSSALPEIVPYRRSTLTAEIIPIAPRIGRIVRVDDGRDGGFLIVSHASNVQVVHGQTSV
jgi:hypothetical protein